MDEVERRLEELGRLVPDMVNKLPRMRADILLQLVQDPTVSPFPNNLPGWECCAALQRIKRRRGVSKVVTASAYLRKGAAE